MPNTAPQMRADTRLNCPMEQRYPRIQAARNRAIKVDLVSRLQNPVRDRETESKETSLARTLMIKRTIGAILVMTTITMTSVAVNRIGVAL